MHIEIQVALNFVISYLYNKLPRRRVNLFGEELEKALKCKFDGHWYPEKPFKGSAYRCLKTGDPIDAVLDRAARESGVPISDILENLPAELSVWVDPGEVSYRIGEKGAVKILFSESNNTQDDSFNDREVTKTFNPEAQCFRPIEIVSTSLNGLTLTPKTSPNETPSSTSPMYKSAIATTSPAPAASFLNRSQEPLTFTTATFAQTKFGSTKLKNNTKRTNSEFLSRMSPTEFSNYLKQRAMQQQIHQNHNNHTNAIFGPIGSTSPSRSISPNPLGLAAGIQNEQYYYSNLNSMNIYPQFASPRNLFETQNFNPDPILYTPVPGKYNGVDGQQQQQQQHIIPHQQQHPQQTSQFNKIPTPQQQQNNNLTPNAIINSSNSSSGSSTSNNNTNNNTNNNNNNQQDNNKILEGLSSFYNSNSGPYQHLLVAN